MREQVWAKLGIHLTKLRLLGGAGPIDRPVYAALEEAEAAAARMTQDTDHWHLATPLWKLDHDDLDASEIVAFSYARYPI